jgi:dipeptidyl aminopeptidase/acylaminoacyl peptidase
MPENKRFVQPDDLFRMKWIDVASPSPDGKYVAYTVAQVEKKDQDDEEKTYSAIWLASTDGGETRQLTSGTAIDGGVAWSPDSKQIAFVSTRAEKPQVYVIAIDGGEARPLTHLKQGVGGGVAWSPDGKHIAFTARTAIEDRKPALPYRVTRAIWRFNGLNLMDDALQSLYVVAATGGDARQVTKDRLLNGAPAWSPDGKELLYLALFAPDSYTGLFATARIVNLLDEVSRDVVPADWGKVYTVSWLPDGKRVVFIGQPNGLLIGAKSDVFVASIDGGMPENRSAGLLYGVGGGLEPDMPAFNVITHVPLAPDGAALVDVQIGGTIQVYRVALEGAESVTPVLTGERSAIIQGIAGGKIAYIESGYNEPPELRLANLDGSDDRKLAAVNDDLLGTLKLPTVTTLKFPGVDGTEVEGFFNRPADSIGPVPTILLIHGGPHGAFGHIFNFHVQMFCGAGYGVLQVNHRASTGYGDAFSTAIKGDWGNLDYKDLMAGVDDAIAQGLADPDKLGVCGLSGGGNLSCWTVGQTDRFKAAVPENPVTNWVSFYGVSDIGPWFAVEQLGGHPHEIPDVYARCSPITYAHRCKTPTLLVQGEADWRCPPEQSEQFYTTLKVNGCIVEMLRLPDQPHGGSLMGAPAARKAHNEALLGWMNRYVLGKTE